MFRERCHLVLLVESANYWGVVSVDQGTVDEGSDGLKKNSVGSFGPMESLWGSSPLLRELPLCPTINAYNFEHQDNSR